MALFSAARTELNAVVPGFPLGDILLANVGALKRGFVFQVVDVRRPADPALFTKSLVLNPRRYTLSEPFSATLTPTEDDTVVAEENGIIIREISLEGTTGLSVKREDAFGRAGSVGTEASGPFHFFELRDIFREYARLKKNPADSPYIQMTFHNVKEDDHFVVVPRSFETPRDSATNRFHFNYRITLAAIQELPSQFAFTDGLLGSLGDLGDAIKDITESLYDARAFLVEALDVLDTYNSRVRNPEEFFESAALSINAVSDFVDGVTINIALGQEFVASTNDLLEGVQELMEADIENQPTFEQLTEARRLKNLRERLERVQNRPEKFAEPLAADLAKPYAGDRNLTESDLASNEAGATVGSRTRLALGSERNAGLDLGAFAGSKRVEIQSGDTIDTLASKNSVPREAIIALNDLEFPFIARGAGPGTRAPGDKILIPVRETGRQVGASPSDQYLTPEDILYGVDLALDVDLAEEGIFDILVNESHGSLDAEMTRGLGNAVQGVQILIGTERGTTTFIPDLGIKRTPGLKGTINNMLLAGLNLREAILSDPRVEGIQSSRIVLEGDVLLQEITPELIGTRDGVTIVVPFGKASS